MRGNSSTAAAEMVDDVGAVIKDFYEEEISNWRFL